jgi:hypothetical protein
MHRNLLGSTKRRVLAILGGLALLLGAGFGAASLASASGTSYLCAKSGTRQVFNFTPCPAGYYPVTLTGGTVGVTAPGLTSAQVSAIVQADLAAELPTIGTASASKSITLDANSPATQIVTFTGLTPYVSKATAPAPSVYQEFDNSTSAPASVTSLNVTQLAPAVGSTERSYSVSITGKLHVGQTFTLTINLYPTVA